MNIKWSFVFNTIVLVGLFASSGQALDFTDYLNRAREIKDRSGFFNSYGDIDPLALNSVRELTKMRRREIFDLLKQQELKDQKTPLDAGMKAVEAEEIVSLDLIITYLGRLEEIMNKPEQDLKVKAQIIAQKIVDLGFATQVIGQIPFILRVGTWAKGVLHKWSLELNTPIEREANNLWNEKEQRYYSVEELGVLKANGVDLSTLNPPPNSGIWRSPGKISEINIKDYYYSNKDFMHYGLKAILPEKNVGTFDKVKISQTTPKIMVKYKGTDGNTYKAKMKFGKDLHADITASALFLALGYPADISRYYRDFKIYFKDSSEISQLKKEWLTYFNGMPPMLPPIHIDSVIKEAGKDEGGEFLIFKECVVEADPKGLLRVGPIDFDQRGLQKWRESRAYALLNLWVENTDWDPDNAKLILRKNGSDDYDFFYVVHDLGCAFGGLLCEKIDRFRANVISKITDSEIQFDFRSADGQPMQHESTLADYRWGARLMAQLTREQIADAVSLGSWPESIQKLLVEKLINRRNEFVKAFGLEGELLNSTERIQEIPVTTKFSTEDGVVLNGKLVKPEIDGYATNYGEYWDSLIWKPLVNSISSQVKFGIAKGLCELERIAVEPVWLGWNQGLIAEVLVSACRDVIKNPKPSSEKDIWLVRDTLKLGIRGGAGFVVAGELDLVKKYTLVYGARTEYEGRNGQGTILNVMLPFQIRKGNLPERYVLVREDMLVPRVRARSDILHFTGVGIELLDEEYLLSRSVVTDKGDDRVVFYEDTSFHNNVAIKLFANLAIARIPFFRFNRVNHGKMNGTAWVLRRSDAAVMKIFNQDLLSSVVRDGDFSKIAAIPGMTPKEIDSKILKSTTWTLNFFGMFQRVRTYRQNTISVREGDDGYDVFKDEFIKKAGFSFFGVREQDQVRVNGYFTYKLGSQVEDPFVSVGINLRDTNTKSSELDEGFIKFLNGIFPGKNLNFTAELHSSNQRWGSTELNLYIAYYSEAIERLMNLDENEFVKNFVTLQHFDDPKVMRAWRDWYSPDAVVKRRQVRGEEPTYLPLSIGDDLMHLSRFMIAIRNAKDAQGSERVVEFTRAIREAIYADDAGNSYDATLFAAIHLWVGPENLFISREVTAPYDTENRFPGGKGLQWENVGVDRKPKFVSMVLLPEDVLEFWTMFDWL